MMRVRAPAVSRSTADWASWASLISVSHSAGSQFDVTMGEPLPRRLLRARVIGLGGVQRPEAEVVEDE